MHFELWLSLAGLCFVAAATEKEGIPKIILVGLGMVAAVNTLMNIGGTHP